MEVYSNQNLQPQKPFNSIRTEQDVKIIQSNFEDKKQEDIPNTSRGKGSRGWSNRIEPLIEIEHENSNRRLLVVEPIQFKRSQTKLETGVQINEKEEKFTSSEEEVINQSFSRSKTLPDKTSTYFDIKNPNEEFLLNEMKAKNKTIIELISFDAEDIRVTNQAFRKLQIAEYAVSFMILLSIGCAVMANEINYFRDNAESDSRVLFLLRLALASNVVTIILTYARYQKFLDWAIVKSYYTKIDTLTTTGKFNEMIFECFLLLIGPYEFFSDIRFQMKKVWEKEDSQGNGIAVVQYYFYELNTILMILSFVKGIIMFRTVTYFSRFTSPRAQRVCAMNGTRANLLFAVKSLMKDNPFFLLVSAFTGTSIFFAFCLQVLERPIQTKKFEDFNYLGDGLWLVLVTITTVGYGDLYPVTVGGRIIGVIICIWGLFLTSFFTVTLTNYLQFKQGQSKAYILLQRLYYKEQLQKEAVSAMSMLYRYRLLQKEMNKNEHKNNTQLDQDTKKAMEGKIKLNPKMLKSARDFRKQMVKFKETTKQIHSFQDGDSFQVTLLQREIDDLQNKFGRLEEEMKAQQCQQVQMNTKLDLILSVLQRNDQTQIQNTKKGDRRNNYVKRHGVPMQTIELPELKQENNQEDTQSFE